VPDTDKDCGSDSGAPIKENLDIPVQLPLYESYQPESQWQELSEACYYRFMRTEMLQMDR